jgi:hypothetical protein
VSDGDHREDPKAPKPISARAAMGAAAPETDQPERPAAPAHRFEHRGREWLARIAGEGAYGTGGRGRAYVVAIHFCPVQDDGNPVREALIPAARFDGLDEEELRTIFDRATPIETDQD